MESALERSLPTDVYEAAHTGPVLHVEHVSKTFPGTRALVDVSLDVQPGEIHALVGSNGSGKSTLIKVLAGYHVPDPGATAVIDGEPFELGHGAHPSLRFVHQDLGLVLELNAMDNIALRGSFVTSITRRIKWRDQERSTHELLDRFRVQLDIHRPLGEAAPVDRTVVAIAAALEGWPGGRGVLVLDEPTAVLPPEEAQRLFAIVRELNQAGTSVLYVSHRMNEIFDLADRVTVLRNGHVVATRDVSDVDARQLANLMAGEDVDPDYRAQVSARLDDPVVLELREVRGRWLQGAGLDVHRGEILGVAGFSGSGAGELVRAIAGANDVQVSGWIRMPQRSSRWHDISRAESFDIPLVPADRAREGIVAEFSVKENLTLSILGRLGGRGRLARSDEARMTEEWTQRLNVVAAGPDAPVTTLSGGNQQKVVIARCLMRDPQIIVLCEPTAGVDVATRVALYDIIAKLARDGLTVLISSSDLGDLVAICTRVVIVHEGRPVGELAGEDLSEHVLIHAMEGAQG
jgi:ABC-type sugar transport system ATPase subunit